MKYLLFVLICFTSFSVKAQKRKVLLDSLNNHGLLINDTIIEGITWQNAYLLEQKLSKEGWRLPSLKEQEVIMIKTKSSNRPTCIVPAGYYYSGDYQIAPSISYPNQNDTTPILGRMWGSFATVMVTTDYNKVFFVKPF